MIDIDHFKEFNDKHAHAAGDSCLKHLGEVFTKFAQHFRIDFYRYGGGEFVVIAYGYEKKELMSIAESLRIAVQGTDIDGHRVSVSIGNAYCSSDKIHNYENVINRADKLFTPQNTADGIKCANTKKYIYKTYI